MLPHQIAPAGEVRCRIFSAIRDFAFRQIERRAFAAPANGPETPASEGLDFERLRIRGEDRDLDAWYVPDPSGNRASPAVLIFHGNNDSISRWVKSLAILARGGIAAMVFDYSGFGASGGRPTVANCAGDARAAYREFRERLRPGQRAFVFGISIGSGILLDAVSDFSPAPDGVIIDAAFSSAREAAVATGLIGPLRTFLYPDLWNNVEGARRLRAPLLVMHSDADSMFPISMAERIFAAAPEPKKLVIQRGVPHDAPVSAPTLEFWQPVIEFVRDARLTRF
jgi:alpha-beta hydrolase superfamily lysophospholipase